MNKVSTYELELTILREIRDYFERSMHHTVFSSDLVNFLNKQTRIRNNVWINQSYLRNVMKTFGIKTRQVRVKDKTKKGYNLNECHCAFLRYLNIED